MADGEKKIIRVESPRNGKSARALVPDFLQGEYTQAEWDAMSASERTAAVKDYNAVKKIADAQAKGREAQTKSEADLAKREAERQQKTAAAKAEIKAKEEVAKQNARKVNIDADAAYIGYDAEGNQRAYKTQRNAEAALREGRITSLSAKSEGHATKYTADAWWGSAERNRATEEAAGLAPKAGSTKTPGTPASTLSAQETANAADLTRSGQAGNTMATAGAGADRGAGQTVSSTAKNRGPIGLNEPIGGAAVAADDVAAAATKAIPAEVAQAAQAVRVLTPAEALAQRLSTLNPAAMGGAGPAAAVPGGIAGLGNVAAAAGAADNPIAATVRANAINAATASGNATRIPLNPPIPGVEAGVALPSGREALMGALPAAGETTVGVGTGRPLRTFPSSPVPPPGQRLAGDVLGGFVAGPNGVENPNPMNPLWAAREGELAAAKAQGTSLLNAISEPAAGFDEAVLARTAGMTGRARLAAALGGVEGAQFARPLANIQNLGGLRAAGLLGRGGAGLMYAGLGNLAATPILDAAGASQDVKDKTHWGITGAAIGGTLGAPLFGVGALPGAAIGGAAGVLAEHLFNGHDGNGSFDITTIQKLPISDALKSELTTQYNMMVEMGTPKDKAIQSIRESIIPAYQKEQRDRENLKQMLALQTMAYDMMQPMAAKNASLNDAIYRDRQSNAQYVPDEYRAAYNRGVESDNLRQQAVAEAFNRQMVQTPQTYYQNKALQMYDQAASTLTGQAIQAGAPAVASSLSAGTIGYPSNVPPELLAAVGQGR